MFKSDIQPFGMYKNLYFVGAKKVSVHLIDTPDGLVLIDTGYPDMYEQIIDSISYLGFDPKNICAIFHSHGHIDHFGCTNELKEISGAKTYISRIDNEIANGTLDLSWAKELNMEPVKPFDADVLVEDGDVFDFGNTKIRCRLTPGHTAGVLSFFVTFDDGTMAAMHGGIGGNSMTIPFLKKYNLPLDCRNIFVDGLHNLASEKVDFVLGNHPGQSDTLGKLEKIQKDKSILNPSEWPEFLKKAEANFKQYIATYDNP